MDQANRCQHSAVGCQGFNAVRIIKGEKALSIDRLPCSRLMIGSAKTNIGHLEGGAAENSAFS